MVSRTRLFSKICIQMISLQLAERWGNMIFESKRSHLEIILSSALLPPHILTPFMNKDSLILYGVCMAMPVDTHTQLLLHYVHIW